VTPEEIELLSELTIVIPTYNRPLELERAIEYWRDTSVTVHILDGSEHPLFCAGQVPGLETCFYHHMPSRPDQDPFVNLASRLTFAASLPVTKYSACVGEDDFYSLSGLVECLEFLELHEDIDAVAGRILAFQLSNRRVMWNLAHISWEDSQNSKSNQLETRVNGRQNWAVYAVCRTALFQMYLSIAYGEKSFTADEPTTHEWIMDILSRALFRTKFVETILMARRVIAEEKLKKSTLRTIVLDGQARDLWGKKFFDFMKLPEFRKHVQEVEDQLVLGFNIVSSDLDLNSKIAHKLVSDQVSHLGNSLTGSKSRVKLRKNLRKLVAKLLPNYFKDIYLLLIPIERAIKMKSCNLKLMKKLLRKYDVKFDSNELTKIEKLLFMPREDLRLKAKN
jgi:glycosyltransferase domain-containing protein